MVNNKNFYTIINLMLWRPTKKDSKLYGKRSIATLLGLRGVNTPENNF